MVRDIVRDEAFLSKKSEAATKEDIPVAVDLISDGSPSLSAF